MNSVTTSTRSARRAQKAWIEGQALGQSGSWEQAVGRYSEAVRWDPRDALYGLNLADALLRAGRAREAAKAAEDVVRLDPANPIATALLVHALLDDMQLEDVVRVVASAPPSHVTGEVLTRQGVAQFKLGDFQSAIQSFLLALVQTPQEASLHYRLGLAFNHARMKNEAVECFRTALVLGLGPLEVGVRDLLAFYERELCDWSAGDAQVNELRDSLIGLSSDAAIHTNPFAHVTLLSDPSLQLKGAKAFARLISEEVKPFPTRALQQRERLRIGYVSSDFHMHATSFLMVQMLESHDHSKFEIFLYSLGEGDGSEVRERIRESADHFVDAQRMTVQELASRVRDDGIDILVDLKGYTHGSRPAIFAYKAAPIQVAYLGFPGTSGSGAIDYIIGDKFITPLANAAYFSEQIAQLPGCYQCNDGTRRLPGTRTRSLHGLPEDALVLCGFNQPYKISPAVFDLWCSVLRKVPHSILWLLGWHPEATAALRREAAARGVDPARIHFAAKVGQQEHLDRLSCADLYLDTWPCNGHTTASDMLWAGVPVITLAGRTFAGRVAGSLLCAIGLSDLICTDEHQYERIVLELANDTGRLDQMKERVRNARLECELFDGSRLASHLENLFMRMWSRALAGLPPEHLPA